MGEMLNGVETRWELGQRAERGVLLRGKTHLKMSAASGDLGAALSSGLWCV